MLLNKQTNSVDLSATYKHVLKTFKIMVFIQDCTLDTVAVGKYSYLKQQAGFVYILYILRIFCVYFVYCAYILYVLCIFCIFCVYFYISCIFCTFCGSIHECNTFHFVTERHFIDSLLIMNWELLFLIFFSRKQAKCCKKKKKKCLIGILRRFY